MSTTTMDRPPSPPGGAPAQENGPNLSHRQIVTILIGLMTGLFLAALDQTIVGTSVRVIADDLHGLSMQAWITTAYLITATIATPIYGKLSDIYGRKPFFLTAITIFVIGSIASTFAQSMIQLAAFRAVQGMGAGGLMSLAMTILGDIVTPRQRAKYQAYFLAVFGTSTVLGPVLGGLLAGVDTIGGISGWRWVFLINVPLGILAFSVVAKVLNVPHERHDHRIDLWGGFALALTVAPLLLVAEQGREWGWGSASALTCFGIGAIGLVLFVLIERAMGDEALIPLRLFRNGTYSVAILGGFIVGIAMFGAITMVPQFLQIVQFYTPTESGLLMLPLMVGIMSASITSGQLTSRTGRYKIFPIIGTALMTVGMVLFAQVEWNSPVWQPMIYMFIIGFGLGNCMQTLIIAVQNAGPRRDMGVSTASATFFRQIGGTTGVAVFMSILFSTLTDNIGERFREAGIPPEAMASAGGGNIMADSSFIERLPSRIAEPILQGFTDSVSLVFWVGAAVAALACLVLMFMREIPLADSGPSAAATAMEGGESVFDNTDSDSAWQHAPVEPARWEAIADADEALDERTEPELVAAGRHHLHPGGNGHGSSRPVASHGAEASGSVTAGGSAITGHIRRPDGTSVAAATLTLIDERGRQASRATAGDDGRYRVSTSHSGAYVLIVSAAGHQPQAASVRVGAVATNLDLVLTGSGGLTGVVRVAAHGTPLGNATVTLTDARGEVAGTDITAADGSYAFSGVGSGSYTLVASREEYRPAAVPIIVPDSGVRSRNLELTAGPMLRGTARTDDGQPVPDARITVLDGQGTVATVARTDASGHYQVGDLPAGEYTVVASGYPPATSRVSLAGGSARHDVWLGYSQTLHAFAAEGASGQ